MYNYISTAELLHAANTPTEQSGEEGFVGEENLPRNYYLHLFLFCKKTPSLVIPVECPVQYLPQTAAEPCGQNAEEWWRTCSWKHKVFLSCVFPVGFSMFIHPEKPEYLFIVFVTSTLRKEWLLYGHINYTHCWQSTWCSVYIYKPTKSISYSVFHFAQLLLTRR